MAKSARISPVFDTVGISCRGKRPNWKLWKKVVLGHTKATRAPGRVVVLKNVEVAFAQADERVRKLLREGAL